MSLDKDLELLNAIFNDEEPLSEPEITEPEQDPMLVNTFEEARNLVGYGLEEGKLDPAVRDNFAYILAKATTDLKKDFDSKLKEIKRQTVLETNPVGQMVKKLRQDFPSITEKAALEIIQQGKAKGLIPYADDGAGASVVDAKPKLYETDRFVIQKMNIPEADYISVKESVEKMRGEGLGRVWLDY